MLIVCPTQYFLPPFERMSSSDQTRGAASSSRDSDFIKNAHAQIDEAHRQVLREHSDAEPGRLAKAAELLKSQLQEPSGEERAIGGGFRQALLRAKANADAITEQKSRQRSATKQDKLFLLEKLSDAALQQPRGKDIPTREVRSSPLELPVEQVRQRSYESRKIEDFCRRKGIEPLSKDQILEKNRHFEGRYKATATRLKNGIYQVDIILRANGETLYTNFVDLGKRDIIGKSNYPDIDKIVDEMYGQKERMNLSDIKYQTWRLAIEKFQEENPARASSINIETMRPEAFSGRDIMESNMRETVDRLQLNFSDNQLQTLTPGSKNFDEIMQNTILGKSYLYLRENYFSDLSFSQIKIEKDPKSHSIRSIVYELEPSV